ncbi:MAG: hypothetical protein ON057_001635 [Glomeribacter sp. 1016415]|nr:hypothetical protein [Glomeribacter sp. 1016415]
MLTISSLVLTRNGHGSLYSFLPYHLFDAPIVVTREVFCAQEFL